MREEELMAEVKAGIEENRLIKVRFYKDGSGVACFLRQRTQGDETISLRIESFLNIVKGRSFVISKSI